MLANVSPDDGGPWKFGWFVFGDPASRSVTVGLNGERLFVDLDRNRQFSVEEELTPLGSESMTWQAKLGAEFFAPDNSYQHYDRSVLLRLNADGSLQVATDGAMVGTVPLDGIALTTIRIDRNSNGRWFDAMDRIFIDKGRRWKDSSNCRQNRLQRGLQTWA